MIVDVLCLFAIILEIRIIKETEERLEKEILNNERLASVINELAGERKVENGK